LQINIGSGHARPRLPRTARMLHGLSESYERDAQRNDAEADLRQNEG
jgi:hypothetical protein